MLNGHHLTFDVVNRALLRCGGAISGAGQLIKIGEGDLRLDGNNTYMGPTRIDEGYVIVGHANGLGVARRDGGERHLGDHEARTDPGPARCSSTTSRSATKRSSWRAQDSSGTARSRRRACRRSPAASRAATDIGINVIAPARLTFAGPVSGPGRLRLVHDGTFVFSNPNNTYTGGLGIGEGGDPHTKVIIAANEGIPHTPVQNLPDGASLTIEGGITQTLTGLTGQGTLPAHQRRDRTDPERQRRRHVRRRGCRDRASCVTRAPAISSSPATSRRSPARSLSTRAW